MGPHGHALAMSQGDKGAYRWIQVREMSRTGGWGDIVRVSRPLRASAIPVGCVVDAAGTRTIAWVRDDTALVTARKPVGRRWVRTSLGTAVDFFYYWQQRPNALVTNRHLDTMLAIGARMWLRPRAGGWSRPASITPGAADVVMNAAVLPRGAGLYLWLDSTSILAQRVYPG